MRDGVLRCGVKQVRNGCEFWGMNYDMWVGEEQWRDGSGVEVESIIISIKNQSQIFQ
jgi:hypothetical protein